MNRLKVRLGKCRWAGFGVCKFDGGFDIGVTILGDGVIYSCDGMNCYHEVIEVGESKKWDDGEFVLEVGWVEN